MARKSYATLIVSVICCLLFTGCSPSKYEVIQYLLPTNGTQNSLHIFYHQEDGGAIGNELNIFQNSSPALQEKFQIQLWNYNQKRIKQWTKVLGIKKFPTFLILDKDGIVLQTQDIEEAKKYLTEH